MKELMIRAHKLAKELEGDYRARLKMALIIVWAEIKKGVNKMVELVGTEKQVKWANDIRMAVLRGAKEQVEFMKEKFAGKEGKKIYIRFVGGAESIVERIENESSAKFFIENFQVILKIESNGFSTRERVQEIMSELA